jgi:hypothetical protein
MLGRKDTVFVEVGVNNVWTKVTAVVIDKEYLWTPLTLDISNIAAGHLFQVRFHAVSGDNRNLYNFRIDGFGVSNEASEAPSGVIAYRSSVNDSVKVLYKDVTGSYGLSYTSGIVNQSVGNEGNSIIAVNRYLPEDLVKMEGKYLTSISAYIVSDFAGTVIPSQLKLAVFINGERVENSTIQEWTGNKWNNFPLSTPIAITRIAELLVGIEAASGETYNRPIAIDYSTVTNPNGNLYSEDGGTTWNYAIDESIEGNWVITANFRDDNTISAIDDDLSDLAYEIYRNGEKIVSLNYGQMYVDKGSISDEDCYAVKVLRSTGGMSPLSEEGCINDRSSIEGISNIPSMIIYPNPTTGIATVAIDFKTVRVYDMRGNMVVRSNGGRQVDLRGLSNGTYLFEVTTLEGNTVTAKVVKK